MSSSSISRTASPAPSSEPGYSWYQQSPDTPLTSPPTSPKIRVTKARTIGKAIISTDGAYDEQQSEYDGQSSQISSLDSAEAELPALPQIRVSLNKGIRRRYTSNQSPFLDPFNGTPATDARRDSQISDISNYLRPGAFAGHRNTLARLRSFSLSAARATAMQQNQSVKRSSINLGNEYVKRIREWHDALSKPTTPAAVRLPPEILLQVYQYLQPCDFDAARHTCRSWFLAGLDRRLGHQMMRKAGCYPAFLADLEHRQKALHSRHLRRIQQNPLDYEDSAIDSDDDSDDDLNEEWMISKRLATESRLSAAWHGSALARGQGHSLTRFTITEVADFDKLAGSQESGDVYIKKFTKSNCGKFVLVIAGTDIFVYSRNAKDVSMKPCVRLVAGKQVLRVSMDSSSGRYAVAALLEGRVGMCWELDDLLNPDQALSNIGESISLGLQTDVHDCANSLAAPTMASSFAASLNQQWSFDNLNVNNAVSSTIPIRAKPTNVYKSVGAQDDLPRSVAICPQRRCVAFGCRTGIELYWVDAVAGRNLNRWFPLSAPSDFLYFLPRRSGVDSAKKLRLVSSAAGPNHRVPGRHNSTPALLSLDLVDSRQGRRTSMTRMFYGDLPFPSSLSARNLSVYQDEDDSGVLRAVDCDHYHAIPLSDGSHMLFTDPTTGSLCLGSDAPLGGPTKLIRKVCMKPPTSVADSVGALTCYAVGQDLSRGVRVVAAYEDGSIFFYNIPSDYFERVRNMRSSADVWDERSGVVGQSNVLMDALMNINWENANGIRSTADTPASDSPLGFRSLQINGAFVCRVESDVEDLQVDSYGGGLQLSVFHHNGQVTKLNIFASRNQEVKKYVAGVDGQLRKPETTTSQNTSKDYFNCKETKATSGENSKYGVKFFGLDGASDCHRHSYHPCRSNNFETDLVFLEELNTQSHTRSPDPVVTEEMQALLAVRPEKMSIEVLTDWRKEVLLSPYLLNLE